MIKLKSPNEIELMREPCVIAATALSLAGAMVKPGVTTGEIDDAIKAFIIKRGAKPSFLGYGGFPGSACISINEEVIHGIPSKSRKILEGDIVSIDVGAYKNGFHGDCANTFPCGTISKEAQHLIDVTRQSFYEGIKYAREGQRLSDISAAIQTYVENNGFSVVRKFVGHGIGTSLHESPEVPNFGLPGRSVRLKCGMTLAIEPMVNEGVYDVKVLSDNWTVVPTDGKLSAHYENTIVITEGEPEILTKAQSEV